MFILKSLLAILSIGVCTPAISQAVPKPSARSTAGKTPLSSLLWEVSGRGLTSPSYLYGTMHIICREDAGLSEGLKKVIRESGQIFFEVDMDNMQELMGALKYARMQNGLKISDLVTPVEYERLEQYFRDNKTTLPFAMMSRFKPYFISAMISEAILDCEQKSSIEQQIMAEAKQHEKEISGLESVEFQASIFDSIPYEKQARDLLMYVDSIDHYRSTTLELLDMYRKQDVENMEALISRSDPGMEQYLDVLLYNRNYRWISRISEQAFMQPTLFAVGAGHLGGQKGLISLLREQGFTVRALQN